MARPVTWLPRLHSIRRSVAESVRSHYSTKDIEQLFQVQPRSAQLLAALLPTVFVGNAQLVEREALSQFLDRLTAASDPAQELVSMRVQPRPQVVRRKLRQLVRTDVLAGENGLPLNVSVGRGTLTIEFATMEDLATALHGLAVVLDEDLDGFASLYEPGTNDTEISEEDKAARDDAAYFKEWLLAHPLS